MVAQNGISNELVTGFPLRTSRERSAFAGKVCLALLDRMVLFCAETVPDTAFKSFRPSTISSDFEPGLLVYHLKTIAKLDKAPCSDEG